ncbi:MAG: hypothetical protein ACOX2R_01930 [Anaerolineae bacterium]|jgi:hypothetical protein
MKINRDSVPTIPSEGGGRQGATSLNVGRIVYVASLVLASGLAAMLLLRQADDIASLKYDIRVLINRQETLRRLRTDLEGRIAAQESVERILELGEAWGYASPDGAREIDLVYELAGQP